MSKKGVLRWLRRTLILSAVGTALYFGWGAWHAWRFETRLAELRASGAVASADFWKAPTGDPEKTAYGILKDAQREAASLESDVNAPLFIDGDYTLLTTEGPFDTWTPEQQAHERRVLGSVGESVDRFDEAFLHERVIDPTPGPTGDGGLSVVMGALRWWYRRAEASPSQRHAQLDRMLRLMRRWRKAHLPTTRGAVWPALILPLLARELTTSEHPVERWKTWDSILAEEEGRLMDAWNREERYERAVATWLIGSWRRREDPLAGTRATLSEITDLLTPHRDINAEDSEVRRAADIMKELGSLPLFSPPYQEWWEWPRLQRFACEVLDQIPAEAPSPWELARVRAACTEETTDAGRTAAARHVVHSIACLRAARAALAARTLSADPKAAPTATAVAAVLPTVDLMSGEPFVVRIEDDTIHIEPPRSDVWDAIGDDKLLRWQVPLR